MAVSKRGRRKVVVEGEAFYWGLKVEDCPCCTFDSAQPGDHLLTILPDDKRFRLYWFVDAAKRGRDSPPFVVTRDSKHLDLDRCEVPEQITPRLIAFLIEEALVLTSS